MVRNAYLLLVLLIATAACASDEEHGGAPGPAPGGDGEASSGSGGGGGSGDGDGGDGTDAGIDAGKEEHADGGMDANDHEHVDGGDDGDDGGGDGGADADAEADVENNIGCTLVTLSFRAEVVTIAGTPFGLESGVDRLRMANGTMTYDTCVRDTDSLHSPDRGEFDHAGRETGAFGFELDAPGSGQTVELEITGSTRPLAGIRGLDYFDFEDGGHDPFYGVDRFVTVNGALDEEAEVDFTIGAGPVDFADDSLPELFPYSGATEEDFQCVQADDYCVTFSIRESTFGDSFLMALHSLQQVE